MSAAPHQTDGDFVLLADVLDDVLADIEAAIIETGGFMGDVLPAQKSLSTAIDRIESVRQEIEVQP